MNTKKAELPYLPIHSNQYTGWRKHEIHSRAFRTWQYEITADVYSHISKKIEQDTMDKFEEHMKNILE